jgi:predicted MFS family arabinose efflux permease
MDTMLWSCKKQLQGHAMHQPLRNDDLRRPALAESTERLSTAPTQATILILAACAAFSVANVYYAQPLLDAVTHAFGIRDAVAGGLITATQLGSTLALLLVLPLGDLMDRKRLLMGELGLLMGSLLAVSLTANIWVLFVGMLALGLLGTAATQGAVAYAATLSVACDRGRVIGLVQSGVLVGVLGSRTVAGLVADLAGWRAVFQLSAVLATATLLFVRWCLPMAPVASASISYGRLLLTMGSLLRHERVLQVRGVLGFLVFAAFGAFWSANVLPLRAAPHNLSHGAIGALGLVGMAGALAAARAGRWADAGFGQRTTAAGLALLAISWGFIAQLPQSMAALVLGIVLLDMGGQAVHVISQSMIFKSRPELHSRLVGCYMLFYASGLGLGAIAATSMFAVFGWDGVCWLGFSLSTLALLFWFVTRHHADPANPGRTAHELGRGG